MFYKMLGKDWPIFFIYLSVYLSKNLSILATRFHRSNAANELSEDTHEFLILLLLLPKS